MSTEIRAEKIAQAVQILEELDIDCWLTFVRETSEAGDPVLPFILGHSLTWQSALIITRRGDRIAIVGRYDDGAVKATRLWPDVRSYVQSIREPLLEAMEELQPRQIAVNYSRSDVKADGLSHGMFELLRQHLAGSDFMDRLQSAEQVIAALRGRKTATEIERIRAAYATTEEIFARIANHARAGVTEATIARLAHEEVDRRGLQTSWDRAQCPLVTTGPRSMVGHGFPSEELVLEPGNILHLDFGVRQHEYCTDIQRVWYAPLPGETEPPAAVQRGFEAVVHAIQAAAAALKPGVEGWVVDAAARRAIVEAGFPEYQHATGHQVGRAAHDGAGVLGPRWERYGRSPYDRVEERNVFTLELGIDDLDGRGYLGLEEMVLVTADGVEWLSEPQTTLPLLGTRE
jgi:Xaa-Pro aminopeptidase